MSTMVPDNLKYHMLNCDATVRERMSDYIADKINHNIIHPCPIPVRYVISASKRDPSSL